jgi:hypothetical protein
MKLDPPGSGLGDPRIYRGLALSATPRLFTRNLSNSNRLQTVEP